jgi:hypothetical protein
MIAALFSGLPLRLPYLAIVSTIGFVMQRLPRGMALLIDNTGVGRACTTCCATKAKRPSA